MDSTTYNASIQTIPWAPIHGGTHGLKWIEATYFPASMNWSGSMQCMWQNPWIGGHCCNVHAGIHGLKWIDGMYVAEPVVLEWIVATYMVESMDWSELM
jgi:hypothetical protein